MFGEILIKKADIVDFACDVLVLKYAQNFYGADELIAGLLVAEAVISPQPGKHVLIPSQGKVAAKNVLFVGTLPLYQFHYGQIRTFASNSLQILAENLPDVMHVAMTMHGVGYGLDEKESFLAQIAGIFDAFRDGNVPSTLERITIVENNSGRATRLRNILKENLPAASSISKKKSNRQVLPSPGISNAGIRSDNKPHVFVAMPFSKAMEDVYILGIQGPVNAAGFLCERVDMSIFTGDILTRIKSRIETAALVIADLTGANPNVYLEVGYAWGKDRRTVLLANKSDKLKFDVSGQRCIFYENIVDLIKKLEADLTVLK
jgi:hypothetical protein